MVVNNLFSWCLKIYMKIIFVFGIYNLMVLSVYIDERYCFFFELELLFYVFLYEVLYKYMFYCLSKYLWNETMKYGALYKEE